jgi:two-component system, chemotaxis family, chemotaxis protein CheY
MLVAGGALNSMPKDPSTNRPYQVLIVEDNADDVQLFMHAMRKVQMDLEIELNAKAVSDGVQGAAELKAQKFDAIFLDINLPPPDGMELTRQIRASAINRNTPVVVITGNDDRGLMTRAFQAGANLFLFKPVDRMRLLRLIQVVRAPIDRERRRLQRVKVKCKVSIESGADRLNGEALDISLNGLFVRAARVFPVGTTVTVDLTLPGSSATIRSAARIVRIVGDEFMGLQLENVGKAESDRLGAFLVPLIVALTHEH